MKKDCENCIYGDVRDYRKVVKEDSVAIVQDGTKNVVCTHTRDKTIDFDGEKATLVFAAAGVGDDHMDLVQQISVAALNDSVVQALNEAEDFEAVRAALKNLRMYK